MTDNDIINIAIQELKGSGKHIKKFKDFSFMNGLKANEDKYKKIRYLLQRSKPFEQYNQNSIGLSAIGIEISNDFVDYFEYKRSLRPKRDFIKIILATAAILSLLFNIYQHYNANSLIQQKAAAELKVQTLENEKQEQIVLKQIVDGLDENDRKIKDFIGIMQIKKNELDKLFEHIDSKKPFNENLGSAFGIPGDQFSSYISGDYLSKFQSQQLQIIRNKDLLNRINEIFGKDFKSILREEEAISSRYSSFQDFRDTNMQKIGQQGEFSYKPNNYNLMVKSTEFKSIYDFTRTSIESLIKRDSEMRKKIEKTLPIICTDVDCSYR